MAIKTIQQFYSKVEQELFKNIIPFWIEKTIDRENGGFYGRITNDLKIEPEAPKSLILHARILWTFATLYSFNKTESYLKIAQRAYEYIRNYFYDKKYGGTFWLIDAHGKVLNDKKKMYGQAFTIYALAAYFTASGSKVVLDEAIEIFNRIEKHNYDKLNEGYFETSNQNWTIAEEMRLSEIDMNEMKSMNTHLHLMEAYTALLGVWPEQCLKEKLSGLIQNFEINIIDTKTLHFNLFFDEEWHPKSHSISFGHDIEGSWLLCEAAEAQEDQKLLARIRETAVRMARITAKEGFSDHNTIYAEQNGNGKIYKESHWWQQAEAIVGFLNAYEITNEQFFMDVAIKCWQAVEDRFIDRKFGEWYYEIDAEGNPDMRRYKVSEWKGPYHNGRACMEILKRLKKFR
jgi:mannobiose 2-epimerase